MVSHCHTCTACCMQGGLTPWVWGHVLMCCGPCTCRLKMQLVPRAECWGMCAAVSGHVQLPGFSSRGVA